MSFIQYIGHFDEVYSENITLPYEKDGIKTIELICKDKTVTFKFNLTESTEDIEYAKEVTKKPLEDLINLLLYHYNYIVRDIELERFNNHLPLSSKISSYSHVSMKPDFKEIKTGIKDDQLLSDIRNDNRFRLFSSAVKVKDPFGKFMFLYSILYAIKDYSQSDVDDYIKRKVTNVEICTRIREDNRKKNNRKEDNLVRETVFSWIRNHIGHTHTSTDMDKVSEKINLNIHTLEHLVKNAIFNR